MLIVLLIPFLFAELYLSLSVVDEIGAGWSVLWIVGSIFVGIKLLNNSKYAIEGGMMNVAKSILINRRSLEAEKDCMPIKEILELIPGTK